MMNQETKVAVQYIGRRPSYIDRLYGTGLSFDTEQVRGLPASIAKNFLRHGDLFQRAAVVEAAGQGEQQPLSTPLDDTAAQLADAQRLQEEQRAKDMRRQELLDQVSNMDKEGLQVFAKDTYNQVVPKTMTLENMRAKVFAFIDEYGAV
ncbi:hypothetical protein [Delftia tsuruhatensis]|uniref:Uncharacterized protein n=2 Tax=Delftia TaxID=80865 RepID=A0ABN4SF70_9BURK|nr:hypothetical protein [Delftia tsuruhatensis]AOV00549.1 hypothetical protein BI380_03860 [Delftia tsuruhatensis]